jgi:DUF4097 and DUF4098 domain-containing protein YvlB
MHHEFGADGPQRIHVELESGDVEVESREEPGLVVDVEGDRAEEVRVERTDTGLAVVGPRRAGFFSHDTGCRVRLRVPVDSDLSTKLGSAGVTARGRLGLVHLTTGSGEIDLDDVRTAVIRTGSGDVTMGTVQADADVKAGSGDVRARSVGGSARVVTGSGSVEIGDGQGALSLKSGSGDLVVAAASGDASLSTASGDVSVGRVDRGKVQLRNVSGDIRLGIAAGTPVWTEVRTTTGRVHSTLPPVGPPRDDQAYVEVRATSVSGDIHLVPA